MSDSPTDDQLLICNCQKSMELDGEALGKALSRGGPLTVHRELCRSEIGKFEAAMTRSAQTGGQIHIACTQESPLFLEIAQDNDFDDAGLRFNNIRERAGWCEAKMSAQPKIAALLADATYESKPASAATITSHGICLVYGAGQAALDVAQKLAGHLSVTLLLNDASDIIPPNTITVPIYKGRITAVQGTLGAFKVTVDGYSSMLPSSKTALDFAMARDGATTDCDLIFDLSTGAPLISAPEHRDGYKHVDPDHRAAVAEAMFEIIDYVGEFEKPLYVSYQSDLCAHARSGQIGCSNCVDNCPTGALSPDGDHIKIDTALCGGCGNCSALCPSGAISYAYPQRYDLIRRVQGLLSAYQNAGGKNPRLLLHDETHGSALISAMARFGRGLPANMIPLSVYSVFQLGHDAFAAMIAAGAEHVGILAPPDKRDDLSALLDQTALTQAFLTGLGFEIPRLHVLTERDPQAVEAALYELDDVAPLDVSLFDPIGSKRDVARGALDKLHHAAPAPVDMITLPEGAPYGVINIDTNACTLCLSCVGACPAGALADHAERPQVSFTESACVQCGVCRVTCPEDAITLNPRYNFTPAALDERILHFEDPFDCIVCGRPFGTKSSVELIVDKLKDHPMFKKGDQIKLIQMCDECRIVTQANANDDPLGGGARPLVRTTDDYIEAEAKAETEVKAKAEAGAKDRDDFQG